jgi:hypothetical protein
VYRVPWACGRCGVGYVPRLARKERGEGRARSSPPLKAPGLLALYEHFQEGGVVKEDLLR